MDQDGKICKFGTAIVNNETSETFLWIKNSLFEIMQT